MSAPRGRVVIGLEMHLQLKTRTKSFSASPYRYGADPNTQVDAFVLGLPGALPVLNREALRLAVRTGLALGCRIADVTRWDRKHYFYPDLPKGYQISQLDHPLCLDGALEIDDDEGRPKRVRIRRAHLEEDAGKSAHDASGARSRVDLNRAGAPLLEIVTEPDIASAGEAERTVEALREIVAYLGTSDGNMQEGQLRCEPTVNVVFENGARTPLVEVKNINSVRNVGRAIRYEVGRQTRAYIEGGRTVGSAAPSTRGWDDERGVTVHQRSKESADDYRYVPEPDLPPVRIDAAFVEAERAALPELPRARRARYRDALGLPAGDAAVLTADPALADWFERALEAPGGPREAKAVANWVQGELLRHRNERGIALADVALAPQGLAELVDLVERGTISTRTAKEVVREILASGASPAALVAERGLGRITERDAVERAVRAAMRTQAQAVADVRAGHEEARERILGEAMRELGGRGDPGQVRAVLRDLLG